MHTGYAPSVAVIIDADKAARVHSRRDLSCETLPASCGHDAPQTPTGRFGQFLDCHGKRLLDSKSNSNPGYCGNQPLFAVFIV
jgi:hypothetical protein